MKEYIERGAITRAFREAETDLFTECDERYGIESGYSHEAVESIIASLPAADVAPVRHGRWIKHEGYDECSECHAKSIIGHNYCHSCGAQMGKEDKHEVS